MMTLVHISDLHLCNRYKNKNIIGVEKLLKKAGIWKKFKDSKLSTGGTNGL